MHRILQVAVWGATLSWGSSLWAAEIRWFGESSCRREREVVEQVESAAGRPLSSIESADFELRVESLAADQWRVEVTTVRRADAARSVRTIRGATCVEVTDAAAVAIALSVGSADGPLAPTEQPQPSAAPANEPVEGHAPVSAKGPRRSSSLEWSVGAGGVVDSSSTPSLALGAFLRFGSSFQPVAKSRTRLGFELEGAFFAPTETSAVAGQAGRFRLAYAAPLACVAPPLEQTTLLGCAGAELGQLSGEGIGDAVTTSHPSKTFWSALRFDLGLGVMLTSRLRFMGRVGVAVPLIRREFVLDGPEVVFQTAPLSVRGQLGVELSL
ncbi:MAG TPA: hypothetical protein VFK05_37790 [Polyangiaceae bacterium]|nr:hypothetical protein [Polyangiaceae bacterium]